MKLSIVIVNYNVRYFLELALLSVEKAIQNINAEVFVVDNNSQDGSVEMVAQHFPWVKLVANRQNLGFSSANNQAIRQAQGEYILLLNPDTVVAEDSFAKVLDFMDKQPDAGGLGVKMIDGTGAFLPESKRGFPSPAVAFYKTFGFSALFPKSERFNRYHLGYLDPAQNAPVDVLSGAFMLMRKQTLDKIGLLDETFFMYGEDIDLSYRVVLGGYKNYYFADTAIIHYKGESTKKGSLNYVKTFYQAMIIFAEKHFKQGAFWLVLMLKFAIYFRAFITLFANFVRGFWQPFLDATLIFSGLLALKNVWALGHFHDANYFPDTLLYINFPIYICTWLLFIYLRGGYDRGSRFSAVFEGLLYGTVFVSAIYGFLPTELRYSRMLIVLGMFWSVIALALLRVCINIFKHKSILYHRNQQHNIAIVADEAEAQRVLNLLYKSRLDFNYIGFIAPDAQAQGNCLGSTAQLPQLAEMYRLSELIFCARNVNYQQIIAAMCQQKQQLRYKIVAPNSEYIVGSNSKNSAGDLYTVDLSFKIAQPTQRRNKKILNSAVGLLLLLFWPLLVFVVANPIQLLKNSLLCLFNRKNWVGYPAHLYPNLPKLAPAVLSPIVAVEQLQPDAVTREKICFFYSKDYHVYDDLDIILRCFKRLGDVGN